MDRPKRSGAQVKISKDGPYVVSGGLPLATAVIGANAEGESIEWQVGDRHPERSSYALCRCGRSANKPFCDGTHKRIGFVGTETASRAPYDEQAELMRGPRQSLTDAESLCAFARFCDPNGKVWRLVGRTNEAGASEHFVRQTAECPSGRLVAWDNATGEPLEPKLEPSIGLVEDPVQECSGPIWLRGGVQLLGADGFEYELRNRVTLCRCGESSNKPYCDGTHAAVKFKAEYPAR